MKSKNKILKLFFAATAFALCLMLIDFTQAVAPLAISNVSVSKTSNSAFILWQTNNPSTSKIEYGYAHGLLGPDSKTVSDTNLLASHSISLTNLSHETEYDYTITATDSSGNTTSFSGTFTTDSAGGGAAGGTSQTIQPTQEAENQSPTVQYPPAAQTPPPTTVQTPSPSQSRNGLVPCGPGTGKTKCEFCDIFTLIQNIINFIFEVSVALAVILIIYGGYLILTAGDSSERLGKGRKTIVSAIIGLAIALGAWMIIDTVMKVLVGGFPNGKDFGPWNKMPC